MSVMEKRLQLLLDARRWELVSSEAERTGRSVASVIRESIDLYFASEDEDERRAAAARAVLHNLVRDSAPVAEDIVSSLREEFEERVTGGIRR